MSGFNLSYPIKVFLDENPYGDNIYINGIALKKNEGIIILSKEMMDKLKPIESYLIFEPIIVEEFVK